MADIHPESFRDHRPRRSRPGARFGHRRRATRPQSPPCPPPIRRPRRPPRLGRLRALSRAVPEHLRPLHPARSRSLAPPPRPGCRSAGWRNVSSTPTRCRASLSCVPPHAGQTVQVGIEFRFGAAIVATGLTITVEGLTTLAYVTDTSSCNPSTWIASWVASPATPLMRGPASSPSPGSRRPTAPRWPCRSRSASTHPGRPRPLHARRRAAGAAHGVILAQPEIGRAGDPPRSREQALGLAARLPVR